MMLAALALLVPSVLALPRLSGTSNLISKRDDYNAIVYQGMYCTDSTTESRAVAKRDGSLISVTVVDGTDPIEGVQNFADYCIDSTAAATSVASTFTVENDCYYDKTFTVDITDSAGNVTSSTFTLNVGGSDWAHDFSVVRPSTAVITSGTDVITLQYDEYEAAETTLATHVWWCDGD